MIYKEAGDARGKSSISNTIGPNKASIILTSCLQLCEGCLHGLLHRRRGRCTAGFVGLPCRLLQLEGCLSELRTHQVCGGSLDHMSGTHNLMKWIALRILDNKSRLSNNNLQSRGIQSDDTRRDAPE